MEAFKDILKSAGVVPKLTLAVRQTEKGQDGKEKTVVVGTGPHTVTVVSAKAAKRLNQRKGQDEYIVWLTVEENGEKKRYAVPVKNDSGEPHYLVEKLADVEEGDIIVLEYMRKGARGYIDVRRPGEDQSVSDPDADSGEIPVVEDDRDPEPGEIPF